MAIPAAGDDFDSLVFENVQSPSGEPVARRAGVAPIGVVEFNSDAYQQVFPDVAEAISADIVQSAANHFIRFGRPEGRLAQAPYLHALAGGVQERAAHGAMSFNFDVAIASESGHLFVVGWSDDRSTKLLSISVIQGDEGWNTRALARCRRGDVEDLLQCPSGHSFGFWFMHRLGRFDATEPVMLRARFADGRFTQVDVKPRVVSDQDLRDTVLGHFASLSYIGNRDIESAFHLDGGAGDELVQLNRSIATAITTAAHVERFGPVKPRFSASYIICLFGKLEYFFLQNALFAAGAGAAPIEFIYVSNSPELTEALHKEARIAEHIYGLSISLVTLPGNAGFSAANNVAARYARSDRLVFINPDVFPRDNAWARRHDGLIQSRPHEQTALFGAPLYYDDGALMHGGMYFEVDRGLSVTPSRIEAVGLLRVEHYGKGSPAASTRYSAARPVPAVTGAFISADRNWFEFLDGFTEDYLFGHYEDADLCLKSLQQGIAVWLQDIRFWHLEGKGSTRRAPHEGGSLVNRWLFTRRWKSVIEDGLVGRTPTHRLLAANAEPKISPPTQASASRGKRHSRMAVKNAG